MGRGRKGRGDTLTVVGSVDTSSPLHVLNVPLYVCYCVGMCRSKSRCFVVQFHICCAVLACCFLQGPC